MLSFSIFKTLYVNFRFLPLNQAKHFPIKIGKNVKVDIESGGKIELHGNCRINIGMGGSFSIANTRSLLHISKNGKLILKGNANFSEGVQLIVDGNLEIGKNFGCNSNALINCGKHIKIGDNVLIGWDTTILDGDGHPMIINGKVQEVYAPVEIGDNVWFAAHTSVLKGSKIGNGSVVAYGGLITGANFKQENLLIGGINKKLKENISWRP